MIDGLKRGDRVFEKTMGGIEVHVLHSLNIDKYDSCVNVFLHDDMRSEHAHLIKISDLITKEEAIKFIQGEIQ